MESLTKLISVDSNPTDQPADISPATVSELDGKRLLLEKNGQRNWSVMALGYRYEAVPGDKLLVASQGDDWYVIGVLEGVGVTAFVAPGDLAIRAPRGKIELVAGENVAIRSPLINLTSKNLELFADKALHQFTSLEQWVRGFFDKSAYDG